jgi:hypothetical protein
MTPQLTKLETGSKCRLKHGGCIIGEGDSHRDPSLSAACVTHQPKGSFGFYSTLGATQPVPSKSFPEDVVLNR